VTVEARNGLPAVDAATLAPLVRALLGGDATLDGPWSGLPLQGGYGGQGLYRFDGDARVGNKTEPWSVVLKIAPPPQPHANPLEWDAPQREALAYNSGFLAQLSGPLVAPRCLGLITRSDGSTWLWLEEIVDERPGSWNLDRFVLAAQHLGRFNGAWLVGDALPDHPWLSRDWLRRYIAAEGVAAATLDIAPDAAPLLRQRFPPQNAARIRQLWDDRELFLAALDRLPQTICHHDAFRRNLFARRGSDGTEQTVAVDWAFTGIGAVGAELAPLIVGSLLLFEVADATPQDLAEAALAGYLTGLREAGWRGKEQLARLGFLATAALLYTVGTVGFIVSLISDPARSLAMERSEGRSMAEDVARSTELQAFQFRLADEARHLLTATG
jgi:hypothetical protein